VIDARLLRQDPDGVRAALGRRHKPDVLEQLAQAIDTDGKARDVQIKRDALRAEINELSKKVGQLRRDGESGGAAALQTRSRALGEHEKTLAGEADQLNTTLRDLLLRIPNTPHPDAPDGLDDHDNPVIVGPNNMPAEFAAHQRVPHWEAATALGILDNERATKISGAMFTMQRGAGATLARALCQYALDSNADAFEEIRPPSLVSTASCRSSPTTPTPSSATTCGPSPRPRCR
jgi:seryl-tRNA synthetase